MFKGSIGLKIVRSEDSLENMECEICILLVNDIESYREVIGLA